MQENHPANPSGDLVQLKKRFDAWRRSRVRGQHIPKDLWTAAVRLARYLPVVSVAKELGVPPEKLRAKHDALSVPVDAGSLRDPRVVRVAPVSVYPSPSRTIPNASPKLAAEISTGTGTVIRLYEGVEAATVGALVAFIGRA